MANYNATYSRDDYTVGNNIKKNEDCDSQNQLPAKWKFPALTRFKQVIVKIQ
jgi:hypothetical protein